MLIPLITFSYSARILLDDGIGKADYSNSLVAFFVMIANLGIGSYGVREAAKIRENREELGKFTVEMFAINSLASIISYILFLLFIFTYEPLYLYRRLLLIYSIQILATPFNFEWLCAALEEYKYITKRSIFFQLISLILCVLFVNDRKDYWIYALVSVGAVVGSNICNTIYVKKVITCQTNKINLKCHMKAILILFARTVSISIYANLDTVMLGHFAGDRSVGVYSVAVKVNKIFIPLISALGSVLIPRLSYLLEINDKEKWRKTIDTSIQVVFLLSIPTIIGIEILRRDLVHVIAGTSFDNALLPMQIIAPVIFLISMSTVINDQILIPYRKDKQVLLSTMFGAMTNVVANMLLIPLLAETGAAMATVIAELAVLIICIWNVRDLFEYRKLFHNMMQYISASLMMGVLIVFIQIITNISGFVCIIVSFCSGILIYAGCLKILRNDLIDVLCDMARQYVNRVKNREEKW